ncbi:DUF2550 family protein [Cellulomonas triticagri]|uniref:DUF2550 family protein n=1 Tax=Cellulomonas triticagri TaxID=2483352 RepID=UPI0013151B7E|nr:DUF2550 family protein [Cellulomonas triticagri]
MSGHHIALVALLLAALVVVVAGLAVSRWHSLTRRVGSFRSTQRRHGRWVRGIAHYGARDLYWWRLRSLAPRPEQTWPRGQIGVVERRAAVEGTEPGGPLLVRLRVAPGEEVELVMTPEAYAGLTSWLEAAPPVAHHVI